MQNYDSGTLCARTKNISKFKDPLQIKKTQIFFMIFIENIKFT